MPSIRIDASEVIDLALQLNAAGPKTRQAVVRAINRVGDMGFTQVRRAVAKQTGMRQADTMRSRGLSKFLAKPDWLDYTIRARSPWTPLGYFQPTQRNMGVRARPWARTQHFRGAFVARMRSGHVGVFVRDPSKKKHVRRRSSVTGHVSWSTLGLRELWGPSLAAELLRDETPRVWQSVVENNLGARINHEVDYVLQRMKPRRRSSGIKPTR